MFKFSKRQVFDYSTTLAAMAMIIGGGWLFFNHYFPQGPDRQVNDSFVSPYPQNATLFFEQEIHMTLKPDWQATQDGQDFVVSNPNTDFVISVTNLVQRKNYIACNDLDLQDLPLLKIESAVSADYRGITAIAYTDEQQTLTTTVLLSSIKGFRQPEAPYNQVANSDLQEGQSYIKCASEPDGSFLDLVNDPSRLKGFDDNITINIKNADGSDLNQTDLDDQYYVEALDILATINLL